MRFSFLGMWVVAVVITAIAMIASVVEPKDEAIKKDQRQIEGIWRIETLEVDGKMSAEQDAKQLIVVNGSDGTWSLRSEDKEISRGTSILDPTTKPKTVDIIPTGGDQILGIYEIGENTRKLCFALSGKDRPTEFSSEPGSQLVLITFQREKAK